MSYSVNKPAIKKWSRQRSIDSKVTLHERPKMVYYFNHQYEIKLGYDGIIFGREECGLLRRSGHKQIDLPRWILASVNL